MSDEAVVVGAGIGGLTAARGVGRRFGVVPLADGRVHWWATASLPEGAHRDDTLDDVASRYRGWHPPVPDLLAVTDPRGLLRHDIYHLATPLPSYARGHVALLGDAAHAITPDMGQGAGCALEDAVTLASVLTGDRPIPEALVAYDETRRPRTQRLVRLSALYGRIAEGRNPVAAKLRDVAARLLPAGVLVRAISDVFDWTPPPQPVAAP